MSKKGKGKKHGGFMEKVGAGDPDTGDDMKMSKRDRKRGKKKMPRVVPRR